jgi:hypothetical protein
MNRKLQFSMRKGYLTFWIAVMLILATSLWGICGITGPPPQNPRVIPPNSHAYGTTYSELAGAWWNWALAAPAAESPLIDPTGENCSNGQAGKIWFLAGSWAGDTERSCTVPTGKAIFFPLINGLSFAPEFGTTEAEVRADVNSDIDPTNVLVCEIDGVPLDDLFSYRAESPEGGFTFIVPEGSILYDWLLGDRYPAVADGYWLLLPPLPKGDHIIYFHAEMTTGEVQDMTYHLTVVDGI